ncbi:protein LNK1-like isoform X1 [Papaver somniferum]|uniref:protein LNK1-like isoform X1 n=1 Tax=Papaver somniferum TaxID=3469 RepID=UPI000E6F7ED2|nr:protein LNK1-like isoform X1 [Papaver somniferum]
MKDWSEYQLDGFVWDEFKESGDHIVPHPGNEQINHGTPGKDCGKKRLNSTRNISDRDLENKDMRCATVNEARGQMLENHSWSCHTDSTKEMASLSDGNCFNGNNNDAMLGNNGAAASVNGSLSQFTLDISAANTDMELLGNDHEEKDNGFLSYYGWPDIGNFEDVDNMFRTCDSTFGQGDITTAGDDFSWFPPSSKAIDGSEDALKSGFKSPCSNLSKVKPEEAEFKFMPVTATQVVNETDKITVPNDYAMGLQPMDDSDYANLGFSYCNMVDTNAESSMPMEQVNFQEKQVHNHNQIKEKRVDSSSEQLSSCSFQSSCTAEQFPNQVERPSNPSLNASCMMLEEKSHSHQQTLPTSDAHLAVTKQLQNIQDRDPDSSCVLEGSSNNSMSTDDSSLEATSFRQLNYVMEQLDIRTKLCIRDSLYRLARSAEQRNNFENSNNCFVDGSDRSDAQTTGDTNKSFMFMDIETDTNPIDRSIAHLLFHRPKDPAEGAKFTEFRSIGSTQPMVPGKLVSQEEVPRVMDTKLVYKNRF